MFRKAFVVVGIQMLIAAVAFGAEAIDLTPKYLDGTWTLRQVENCGLKEFEHIAFHRDGTIETSRHGLVDALGFWRLEDGLVRIHLLASPAHYSDAFKDLTDRFDSFLITVMPLAVDKDAFEAVGAIGEQMQREKLFRCE